LSLFCVYGVRIRSEFNLDLPTQSSAGAVDVCIRRSSVHFPTSGTQFSNGIEFRVHPSGTEDIYIRWPQLFQFRISEDGSQIDGEPLAPDSVEAFRTFLLGPVLSFAFARQGIEALHATVVVTGSGAIAFLGDSGYGKSTLAASFLAAGDSLLTDDLLVLRESGDGLLAFPGPGRIKLFPEIATSVLSDAIDGPPMNPFTSKRIMRPVSSQLCLTPARLKAIYCLRDPMRTPKPKRILTRRLRARMAFMKILENCFNTRVTDAGRLARQFAFANSVVERVPIKSLSYPRQLESLPRIREAILAETAA
jgi:hypothetical protein